MAFSVSPTPSYTSLPYSKGPKSVYYTNENYLKLYLNVSQTDDDDEWGRTDAIAFRSLIDHVTDIWTNLYGPDPLTSGAGIAGTNTRLLEIVDTTASRIVIPRISGTPAESNSTSATVLQDGSLTFDGSSESIGVYTCGATFDFGLKIIAGPGTTGWKQIIGFDQDNFAVSFLKAGASLNKIVFDIPSGAGEADTLRFSFGNAGVLFDTSVGVFAGVGNFTSINTGTGAFSQVNVSTALSVTSDSIFYCGSTVDPENWLLTKYRLVLGPNLAGNKRVELNNAEGLVFYCGTGGTKSGQFTGSFWAQYYGASQLATVVSDGAGAHFKLDGGSELVLGTSSLSYIITNNFRFIQVSGATSFLNIDTTANSLDYYTSSVKTFSVSSGSITSYSFYVGTGTINPSIAFDNTSGIGAVKVTAEKLLVVDPDAPTTGYTSISYPTAALPDGGITVFCGGTGNHGAYYYSTYMNFVSAGVQKLTLLSTSVSLHNGASIAFSGTTAGSKNVYVTSDEFRVQDPDNSAYYVSLQNGTANPFIGFYALSALKSIISYDYSIDSFTLGSTSGSYLNFQNTGSYNDFKITSITTLSNLRIIFDYIPLYSGVSVSKQIVYKKYSDLLADDKVLVWNG